MEKPVKVFVNTNQIKSFYANIYQLEKECDEKDQEEPILAASICRTFHDNCMIFIQRKKQAHRLQILLGFKQNKNVVFFLQRPSDLCIDVNILNSFVKDFMENVQTVFT